MRGKVACLLYVHILTCAHSSSTPLSLLERLLCRLVMCIQGGVQHYSYKQLYMYRFVCSMLSIHIVQHPISVVFGLRTRSVLICQIFLVNMHIHILCIFFHFLQGVVKEDKKNKQEKPSKTPAQQVIDQFRATCTFHYAVTMTRVSL